MEINFQQYKDILNSLLQSKWVYEVFAVILFACVARLVQLSVFRKLVAKTKEAKKDIWLSSLIYAIYTPISYMIIVLGISYAIYMIKDDLGAEDIFVWHVDATNVALILLASWSLMRFVSRVEELMVDPEWGGKEENKTNAIAAGRVLRLAIAITTVLVVLQVLHIPITGVLALGSAGTLIIGIAAKDLLANFFGGLMIFTDSPFKVGDWIRSNDKNIEGTVEHIGWRLTRIRTFDKRPLYVPNATFLTISIENPSRMRNRRILMTIGLRYQDFDKVKLVSEKIEEMLLNDPEIDTKQTLFVAFNKFSASSLDLQIYTFTKTTNWVKFMKIQQDVFVKISEIVQECGAEMAFPTTTLDLPAEMGASIEKLAPN